MSRRVNKLLERSLYLISPVCLMALWQIVVMLGLADRRFVPAPSDIVLALARLSTNGELPWHILVTLYRVGGGFVVGSAPAIAVGLLMAMFRPVRIFSDPLI